MIIDSHVHFYPDHLYQKVMAKLCGNSGYRPPVDGSREDTLKKMKAAGVDRFVYLPVATSTRYQSANRYAQEIACEEIISFGTMHPAAEHLEADVEEIAAMGLKGIKLHPQYQCTAVDDPRYVRIVRHATKCGLAVVFHAGYDGGLPPPYLAPPKAFARLLDQVEDLPDLRLIAAHLGGFKMYDDVETTLVGRNVYFDTGFVAGGISDEQFRRIIENHGYQRILLGSDCPWQSPAEAVQGIRDLKLPPQWQRAIFAENILQLLGLELPAQQ